MADFEIKRGDSHPALVAVLSDADGPIDLTTAVAVLLLFKTPTGTTTFSRACAVTGAASGEVTYDWSLADAATGPTSLVNTFNIEWEIEWGDGAKTTVPNKGYKTVEITPDLG
jgi:hypothetical protein